jgi:predicted Ser/Thr protein kinase
MIAPGTVLQNRYVVERQIGEGGMGAVYVATDRRFGSTVALKETFFDDPSLRKAFEREARLLNRLRHHALPRVSDHFEESEGQFLVMEYIPGEDLSQMLKANGGEGFPTARVLAWADQLLDALEYLHTQEPAVIHRDIKPQNLKLTTRDQIVLLDFGLAKGTPLQTRVTQTGSLFGYSFNYAPIEQMQGAGTDPRSDLYSLGATVYHLLTGATPPDALTRATVVLNGDPDPLRHASELNAHVPVSLAEALSRAMALSASRRFASAEEMRRALKETAHDVAATAGASGASAAATFTEAESEQKTRLLDAGASGRTSPHDPRARGTGLAGVQDAATVISDDAGSHAPAAAATSTRDEAATTSPRGLVSTQTSARGDGSTSVEEDGGKSIVTQVRIADAPSSRGGGHRAFYLAIGLFSIALAGACLFMFLQDDDAGTPVSQPAPQATTQPAQTAPPTPEPTQQAAEATPAPTAAAQRRATSAPPKTENRAAPPVEVAAPVAPPAPGLPPDVAADPLLRGRNLKTNPLTEEELREIMRRAAGDRRRARAIRQRILEEQRRQRMEEQQRRRNNYPSTPPPQQP